MRGADGGAEAGAGLGASAVRRAGERPGLGAARVAHAEDAEEAGSALHVGQSGWVKGDESAELGPCMNLEPLFGQQGGGMMADDAEQVDHVTREIIQDLDGCRAPTAEEHPAHADERFGVAMVRYLLDERREALGQVALTPDPRRKAAQRAHGWSRLHDR